MTVAGLHQAVRFFAHRQAVLAAYLRTARGGRVRLGRTATACRCPAITSHFRGVIGQVARATAKES